VLAPVGPGAFVPLKLAIASADTVGNDVYVAVVVDFGSGSSMPSVSKCVPVASNAHDSDALAAAVGALNLAYSSSGLLCSIDNDPVNGVQNCGESVGSGNFDYWSYWHGSSGSWVYANDGPAEHSVASQANDVEGWRFQVDQPDNSSDPPPGVAPSYAQICNPSTEVPPAQTPPAATPTTAASATPTPPSAAAATGRAGTGPALGTTPTIAAGTRPKSGVSTKAAAAGATTTTTRHGSGDTASGGGSASGASGTSGAQGSSSTHRSIAASAASSDSGGGASSNVLPVILIAAAVAALGGLALFRWRRRPAEE
jgi:hypothetical protein